MPGANGATTIDQPPAALPGALAHCRQARRLRAGLAHNPVRMHRELRELGAKRRAVYSEVKTVAVPTSRATSFADRVAEELEGPVLRYARRRSLLSEASRAGIGAFEANLIIAAVQHERRGGAVPASIPRHGIAARRLRRFAPMLVVAAIEAAIALGAWQVVCA